MQLTGGVSLALGANVGTCVTAVLAAMGQGREAMQVAMALLVARVIGVIIVVTILPVFLNVLCAIAGGEMCNR